MTRRAPLLALLALLAPAVASGASSLVIGIQDHRLDIDTGLLPDLDPVGNDQTSLRATWTWDVGDRLTVIAQGGAASSFLELTDQRLNGPTDLRLRALYRPSDAWAVGLGTVVPFGLYELSSAEVTTAQWTWNPRSGFPIGTFGEGLGWEATIARGFALSGTTTLGFAGAWLQHAEFSLLEGGLGEYRLGSEIGVSGALDWAPSRDRRFRGTAAYKLFGADRLNGADHVDQGDQIEIGGSLDAPIGPLFTSLGARVVFKGDNTVLSSTDPDSLVQLSQAPGTYLSLYARLGRPLGEKTSLFVEGTFTTVSGSEYTIGSNGNYLAIGPGFGWRPSPGFSLGGRFAFITGDGDRPRVEGAGDEDLSFTGTDVLFTVEVRQ